MSEKSETATKKEYEKPDFVFVPLKPEERLMGCGKCFNANGPTGSCGSTKQNSQVWQRNSIGFCDGADACSLGSQPGYQLLNSGDWNVENCEGDYPKRYWGRRHFDPNRNAGCGS